MAGAGSMLGKPKKSAGKSAPPASSQAKAGQAPGEAGPSRAKAKAKAEHPPAHAPTTTTQEKAKPPKGTPPAASAASQPSTPSKQPAKPQVEGVPLKTIGSKTQLEKFVKEAGEQLVVIFFSGTWCETCQGLKPIMREMAQLNTLVIFYEVNVDDSEDTAEACDIIHIPTFQFYKMGKKVAEILDDSSESVEEKIKELK